MPVYSVLVVGLRAPRQYGGNGYSCETPIRSTVCYLTLNHAGFWCLCKSEPLSLQRDKNSDHVPFRFAAFADPPYNQANPASRRHRHHGSFLWFPLRAELPTMGSGRCPTWPAPRPGSGLANHVRCAPSEAIGSPAGDLSPLDLGPGQRPTPSDLWKDRNIVRAELEGPGPPPAHGAVPGAGLVETFPFSIRPEFLA
jgi:hypothetical protein